MLRVQTAVLAAAAVLSIAACGAQEEGGFRATLSGENQRPIPVTTAATGSARATLEGTTLTITGDFANLTGPATAAHIHGPATRDEQAPMMCALSFTAAASGTLDGTCDLSAEGRLQALQDGKLYVNVHTGENPAGELRGQLE